MRDGEVVESSVAQYALSLRGSLYGGDLEICILASLFKMRVFLFNVHQWSGDKQEKLYPAIHQCTRRNGPIRDFEISLLWEQSELGGRGDHYSLLCPTRASAEQFALSSDGSDDDVLPDNLCIDMSRTNISDDEPSEAIKNASSPVLRRLPNRASAVAAKLKDRCLQGTAPSELDIQLPTPPPSPAVSLKKRATTPLARFCHIASSCIALSSIGVPPPSPPLPDVRAQATSPPPPVGKRRAATPLSLSRMREILTIVGRDPSADGDDSELFLPIYGPWYQVRGTHTTHVTNASRTYTSQVTRHTSTVRPWNRF